MEQKFPIKTEPDFRSSPGFTIGSFHDAGLSMTHNQQLQQQQQRGIENLEQTQQNDLPLLVGKLLGGYNSSTPNHSPVLNPRHHLTKHSHTRSQVSLYIDLAAVLIHQPIKLSFRLILLYVYEHVLSNSRRCRHQIPLFILRIVSSVHQHRAPMRRGTPR